MKKKLLYIILVTTFICPSKIFCELKLELKSTNVDKIIIQDIDGIYDAKSFLEVFALAYEANDQARMVKIVKQSSQYIYVSVFILMIESMRLRIEGQDSSYYFNVAEAIAKTYESEFRKRGMINLIQNHKLYTKEMCKEYMNGYFLFDKGKSFYKRDDWEQALEIWNEAFEIFDKLGTAYMEAMVLEGIGDVYKALGDNLKALHFYQEDLRICRDIGDFFGEAEALSLNGDIYLALSEHANALSYHQKSLEIFKKLGSWMRVVDVLVMIGVDYYSCRQYKESLDYYQKALRVSRENKYLFGEIKALSNIGIIYSKLNQYKEALDYYKEALEISRNKDENIEQVKILNNIAATYVELDLYNEALEYFHMILEIYQSKGDKASEAKIREIIGRYNEKNGEYTKALDYYKEAREIYQKQRDNPGEIGALNNIVSIYTKQGLYLKVLEYRQRALELSLKIKDSPRDALPIKDGGEESFLFKFMCAMEENDRKKMEDLIKGEGPIVYSEIVFLSDVGTKKITEGKDASLYFNTSKAITEIYSHEYKQKGAIELIKKYELYDRERCSSRLNGITLLDDGRYLRKKGQYTNAQKKLTKALEIFKEIDDVFYEASVLLEIGIIYRNRFKYTEALDYHQHALKMAQQIGFIVGEARVIQDIGLIYRRLEKYTEALDYHNKALEMSKKISDDVNEAHALASIGLVYISIYKHTEALEYLLKALEIYRESEYLEGEISALSSIATVYQNRGLNNEALEYLQKALELSQNIKDDIQKANSLSEIGSSYRELGHFSEALEYLQKALEIYRKSEYLREDTVLLNIGIVYRELGNFTEALECHKEALEISQENEDEASEAVHFTQIGLIYNELGLHTKALDYHKKALEISQMIEEEATKAQALGNIGLCYSSLGQYKDAINYYQKAVDKFKEIGSFLGEARNLSNIGNDYFSLGQNTESLDYKKKAFEIFEKIGNVFEQARTILAVADCNRRLGLYSEAIQLSRESMKIFEQLGARGSLWATYLTLGRSLWESGKHEEAVSLYDKAVYIIEEVCSYTKGFKEEERSFIIADKRFVCQEFIELLLELHRKFPDNGYDKQAFKISDMAKSWIFQELMAKAGARMVFAGEEAFLKMIKKEQQLMGEMNTLQNLLSEVIVKPEEKRTEEVIEFIKKQVFIAKQSLRHHEKEIDIKYPRYGDLKRPKPLSVEELQEILKPDEIFLSYSVGENKSVAFFVGKTKYNLIEIAMGREELSEIISKFRKGLDDVSELTIDLEKFDPAISYKLYQKIFQPISDELQGIERLYLSADDLLYTLPFEALVDRSFDQQAFEEARKKGKIGKDAYLSEYGTLHYLIDTYTITYLPSASVLRSLREYTKPGYGRWSKPLIAFADPVFGPEGREIENKDRMQVQDVGKETELAVQVITSSVGTAPLERLEESAEEAEAIAEEVGGKAEDIYLRENATEENVYLTELKESRYLLFSTHGLLGGDFSGIAEPALVLTLVGNPAGRDGFLTMSEVFGLDLNAEVVILSACNTYGRGEKAGNGEGFAGLTRSFMYAGTKSILVTHWSVESQAAKDLMVETFRGMKEELSPDKALQNAKLEMRKSTFAPIRQIPNWKVSRSHPYFWAPFVLVGER